MNWKRNLLTLSLGPAVCTAIFAEASAATRWERNHPRRTEVIGRTIHQSHRINEERREGDLSAAQAHRIHSADRDFPSDNAASRHIPQSSHRTSPSRLRLGAVPRINLLTLVLQCDTGERSPRGMKRR